MKIVNIIAVAKMIKPFDLDLLSNKLENTEMASIWLKMRLKPENYYIAFYPTGKFLIIGIKDINMVDIISKRVIKLLEESNIDNSIDKVEIKNICNDR